MFNVSLTFNINSNIIEVQKKRRKTIMLTLKYNDLTDFNTLTSKLFDKRQREIEWLETKVEKMKSFDIALTNYLQTHGEMSLDLYDEICVMFEHSDKTVSEIFMEIEKRG